MGVNNSIINYKFKFILRAKFFLTLRMLDKSLSAHPLPFCTKLGCYIMGRSSFIISSYSHASIAL